MTIKKLTVAISLSAALVLARKSPGAEPARSPWKSFEFLIGTWEAKTTGGSAGATASGTYSFQTELKDHVLARHSVNSGCKGPADFDCLHTDLLYIYPDAGDSYQAVYFDNEGHVIRYGLSFPTAASVVFLSNTSAAEPQFRLSYELKGSVLYGKFQMRLPGQAEFKSYLEWSGGKRN
jgi:hypothetical protein